MIQVDIGELMAAQAVLDRVNTIKLEEIQWVDKGVVLNIDPRDIQEWKFVGLSNTDFVYCNILGDKGNENESK